MSSTSKALVVYFSYSGQTERVAMAVADALGEKGYEVFTALLGFTDPHYSKIFSEPVPMRLPALRIPMMLIPQRRRRIGEIRIPPAAGQGDYDLVVIGSPTWWLTTSMPVRSYLHSPEGRAVLEGKPFAAFSVSRRYWKGNMKDVRKLGEGDGGSWLEQTHFTSAGGQVKSMLSWLGYMKHGETRERVLGLKMPPPNLEPDFEQQARDFVDRVAEQLAGADHGGAEDRRQGEVRLVSSKRDGEGRPVVITGTSTGIGAASALTLAGRGFRVFAGVRNAEDGEALKGRADGELTPLLLDITDEESIAAAVAAVQAELGEGGLHGLVNNAGIVKPGPLELQPLDDFRRQLEVNLIGQLAMTQAFLPLIRRGQGRIVNVGSIGGHVVLPLHGAYSASKFGMEAISDALRLELRQWQIPVSLIDPGATETAIFGKTLAALDDLKQSLATAGHSDYAGQIDAIRRLVETTADGAAPVEDLADTVAKALTAKKPKSRYLAGAGAKEAVVLARTATDSIKDRAIVREAHLPAPE